MAPALIIIGVSVVESPFRDQGISHAQPTRAGRFVRFVAEASLNFFLRSFFPRYQSEVSLPRFNGRGLEEENGS
jgi:hypothetical protein